MKRVPLIGATLGATTAARLFTAPGLLPIRTAAVSSTVGRAFYTFFNRKWFFDKVYAEWVAAPILRTAYAGTYQTRDRGLLELLGPRGVATALLSASDSLTSLSLGFLFRTLLLLLLALTVLLARVGGWATISPRVDLSCVVRVLAALAITLILGLGIKLRLRLVGKWPSGLWRWLATPDSDYTEAGVRIPFSPKTS